jgi:hypothetical protein
LWSARRRLRMRRRSTRTSEPGTLRVFQTWPAYVLIAVACMGGVHATALMYVCLAAVSGTRCYFVLCRTLQHSLIGRHLSAALSGLGACTCRARTRWYCVAGMRCATCFGAAARSAPARPVDPACTALTVGPSGLMRRGLFESVWLGSQAFFSATAFNQNIGAWNTASMTTIDSVCPHCHRLRVRAVAAMALVCATLGTHSNDPWAHAARPLLRALGSAW